LDCSRIAFSDRLLGYLDDLIIVPAGVWLLLKLIPESILLECRVRAEQWSPERQRRPRSLAGLLLVIVLWCVLAWWLIRPFVR
jgi:hypothetical protein